MTRRGAGEGSIFRDPQNGRWRALVDVGADASGRRQRKKLSERTRAEVLLKMREVQRDAEDGLASGGRHLTVATLAEEWLRHRSGELSTSTLEVRTWAARQHVVPALGARRVRQLSAEDVSLFLRTWRWPATPGPAWRTSAASSSRCSVTPSGRAWYPQRRSPGPDPRRAPGQGQLKSVRIGSCRRVPLDLVHDLLAELRRTG